MVSRYGAASWTTEIILLIHSLYSGPRPSTHVYAVAQDEGGYGVFEDLMVSRCGAPSRTTEMILLIHSLYLEPRPSTHGYAVAQDEGESFTLYKLHGEPVRSTESNHLDNTPDPPALS